MSFGRLITNKLKNFDFLGEGINFSINDEPHLKTVCGGVLRLILYFIGIFLFYFFGKDFIFKQNPRVDYEVKESYEPVKISYTSNDFFFALRFENFLEANIEISDYFHLVATYDQLTYNKNHTFQNFSSEVIPIIRCSEKKFDNVTESFFTYLNKSEYFCPQIPENKPVTIFGDFLHYSKKISLFNVHLQLCLDFGNPDVSKKKCKNYKKFFDDYLKNDDLYVRFIAHDIKFDKENHGTPLRKHMIGRTLSIGKSLKRRNFFYFSKTEVTEDDGILFPTEKTFVEYGYSKGDSELFYIDRIDNDDEINSVTNDYLSIFILSDSEYNHYTRNYMKIQNVVALLFTFMNFLFMIIKEVYAFYNKFRMKIYFFRRLVRIRNNAHMREDAANVFGKFSCDNIIKNTEYCKNSSKIIDNGEFNLQLGIKELQDSKRKLNISNSKNNTNNSIINETFKNMNKNNPYVINAEKSFNNITEPVLNEKKHKKDFISSWINSGGKIEYERNQKIEAAGFNFKTNSNHPQTKSENKNKSANGYCMKNIFDEFTQSKNFVKLSFWEILKIRFIYKYKSPNRKYYLKSEEFYNLFLKKFDVFYYLKKMRNLSLLKKCLLAENELSLLNFISNKYYSVEFYNDNNNKIEAKSCLIDRQEKLEIIVHEMFNEVNKSPVKNLLLRELSSK